MKHRKVTTYNCSVAWDILQRKFDKSQETISSCSKAARNTLPRDLNYPSMAAKVAVEESFTIKFHRTVTNVGNANSTYKAKIFSRSSLKTKVVPEILSFLSASLVWSDGSHSVRSPIVVYGGEDEFTTPSSAYN
ncbi:hypothetical protein OIU84_008644 [Salix udensis]|uniref:Subtilisin-like protease fibronectin type-III domain-containing protein n=1 Tax=Salix udensis TaxID=889485 RepID=A0AAD6NXT9_9ROSI|nr:hypothetical protein OIU84_008644 [Salix udensis]KAJ6408989.1 hypothetical protein OIU84_008644 [Salix udensis]